jgi:Cytochrome C oxidase, cbb3-type, subunit III
MRKLFTTLGIVVAGLLLIGMGAYIYLRTSMHGFSARGEPSRIEAVLAAYARDTAMPLSAKTLKNPIRLSLDVQHEAMAHFADHCAVCHANNGSGQTMFGKGMYPKPPDLRQSRTQNRTDGEIFSIIENGIRMSGMPAFGEADTADDSWKLVHFIRHLPQVTPGEETQMEFLNPKTPEELQEEKDEEQFLNGGDSSAKTATRRNMKGHSR